jgi:hypothetical protein
VEGRAYRRGSLIGSLALRDGVLIALLAGLIVFANAAIRAPLHMPGRSGFFWVAIMLVGQAAIAKKGTGTLIGLLAGLMATFVMPGSEGPLTWVKFLAAGLTLDLVAALFHQRLDRYGFAIIAGVLTHLAKLVGMLLTGLIMGIPARVLGIGLGLSAVTHTAFGAGAGVIAALAARRLAVIAEAGVLRGWAPAGSRVAESREQP